MKKNTSRPAYRQVGLYNPYLDTLGGGEKHILSIIKIFEEEGMDINIFWDQNLLKKINDRLKLNLKRISFKKNVFHNKDLLGKISALRKLDYFFYVPDGSYFFSPAKHNYIFSMVPKENLYPVSFINKIKTLNYKIITNSIFTHKKLARWKIKSEVIYPYIDKELLEVKIDYQKKEKIILSVGRFFSYLHSKRQDLMIKTFKKLKQINPLFKDFRLILVGGLKPEDKIYFDNLRQTIGSDSSIVLKPNIDSDELYQLYQKAIFYWHFAGYGINDNKSPELVEHLGISPLEAMASGCLTFCYRAGGPKELIKHKDNGFLFTKEKDLIKDMVFCLKNQKNAQRVANNGRVYVAKKFNYQSFKNKVKKVFHLI